MNKTTLNSQKEKHSMLSLRRATRAVTVPDNGLAFLSTLSLRRATSVALPGLRLHLDFYPRSPCGERQYMDLLLRCDYTRFLSTLSLRRATSRGSVSMPKYRNFYPRSPCGERPVQLHAVGAVMPISIHALLAESDGGPASHAHRHQPFLSTLSLRRATLARGT